MDTWEIVDRIRIALGKAGRDIPPGEWSRDEIKLLRKSPPFAALFKEYKIDQASDSWAWVMLVAAMASDLKKIGFRKASGPNSKMGWERHIFYCVVESYRRRIGIKTGREAVRELKLSNEWPRRFTSHATLDKLCRDYERGAAVFRKEYGNESRKYQSAMIENIAGLFGD